MPRRKKPFLRQHVALTPTAARNLALAVIAMLVIYGRLPQDREEAITGLVLAVLSCLRTSPRDGEAAPAFRPRPTAMNALFMQLLLAQVSVVASAQGQVALDAAERKFTVPEKDVRKACKGMSEEDTLQAIELWRKVGDAISDAAVFTASRGRVDPD